MTGLIGSVRKDRLRTGSGQAQGLRPEPAARRGGSSGAGLGGERGAQVWTHGLQGVSQVAASVPQNRGELWGWDILGPVRRVPREERGSCGRGRQGPWIGQHMEGMWPHTRGNGSEETPRGQPDEASAANRQKGQAHGVEGPQSGNNGVNR